MKLIQRSSVLLPEPAGADDRDALAAAHVDVDAVQYLERAEVLVQVDDVDQRFARSGALA